MCTSPGVLPEVCASLTFRLVSELSLKLFVAGESPRTRAAASGLARACGELLGHEVAIETIDVLAHPEVADEYRILTTPTVVRELPLPRRRVTGDLRDLAQVLAALAIHPSTEA
jgi:circadian clock protein KaiB